MLVGEGEGEGKGESLLHAAAGRAGSGWQRLRRLEMDFLNWKKSALRGGRRRQHVRVLLLGNPSRLRQPWNLGQRTTSSTRTAILAGAQDCAVSE
jgi:hypothetical protein